MRDISVKIMKFMNLIKYIHENKELPKKEKDKDLFMFYTALQQSAKKSEDKQKEGIKLTDIESLNLHYYNLVKEALSEYKLTKEQKLELLLEFIRKNHSLPKWTRNLTEESEKYPDGTYMLSFLQYFKQLVKNTNDKQNLNQELTDEEVMYLKYDSLIKEELAKYQMTKAEKVEELIEFIKKNHRMPRPKQFNKGKSEILYKDKMDMSEFYQGLQTKRNNIVKNKMNEQELTIEEQEIINFYNRIQETLVSVRISKEEKVEELITFINKNHRLPRIGEAKFQDGKDMRQFYEWLNQDTKDSIKKQNNNMLLTDIKQQNLQYYNRVKKALSLHKMNLEEIAKTDLSEIDLIIAYLDLLKGKNSYEEMSLLCDAIIEKKNLNEEEETKLRSVFQKYIKCAYQQLEEKEENEMHDAIIKIK